MKTKIIAANAFAIYAVAILIGVVLISFYALGKIRNSEALMAAKEYVKSDPLVLERIGRVEDYGYFVTGSVKSDVASLNFEIKGGSSDLEARCNLAKDPQTGKWQVLNIKYK